MINNGSLVERQHQLQALETAVVSSTHSGTVVLISAEAGFGKTSLIETFTRSLDHRYQVLTATCEPVGIPAAFAPLFDLLDDLPDELRDDIRSGIGRPAVYSGMLDLIKNERVVLVFEDMHWADEATLGLVRYLGRRIAATNSTLLITYRSEEVDLSHPLRLVIADLGSSAERIDLPALTPAGVAEMARGLDVDPHEIHETTLGNPFFVEEVIRHPGLKVPPTVANAVLASAAQLPEEALEIIYLVALSPDGVPLRSLAADSESAGAHVDQAVQRRLLNVRGGVVSCRHELIRDTFTQTIPPSREQNLHLRLLTHLEAGSESSPDIARLAYHSIGAGNADKAITYSLQAARDAARAGAHRQAAFHYSNALRYRDSIATEDLSEILLEAANEHCAVNHFDRATELARMRLSLAADVVDLARAHAWVGFFESRKNDLSASHDSAMRAIAVLSEESPSEELALALAVIAWVEQARGNWHDAVAFGERAIEAALQAGSLEIEIQAATTTATARWLLGDDTGITRLEKTAAQALEADTGESAARVLNNLGVVALLRQKLTQARHWFEELIDYATVRELDAWYVAAITTLATININSGRWDDADRNLELVLGQRTCLSTEIEALANAAILRARRGDPGAAQLVEKALAHIGPDVGQIVDTAACILSMEAAWLGLLPMTRAADRYASWSATRTSIDGTWNLPRIAFWASRLGFDRPEGDIVGPARLEWDGDAAGAATEWEALEFPVEAAITRAILPHSDLGAVFSDLAALGAEGVIRGLQRELPRRGVKKIPRGERQATKQNPAGLTPRQAEVLDLMTSGFSNAAIARELFISEKTASHHVSAILTKLNVASRLEAVATATSNGWSSPVGLQRN